MVVVSRKQSEKLWKSRKGNTIFFTKVQFYQRVLSCTKKKKKIKFMYHTGLKTRDERAISKLPCIYCTPWKTRFGLAVTPFTGLKRQEKKRTPPKRQNGRTRENTRTRGYRCTQKKNRTNRTTTRHYVSIIKRGRSARVRGVSVASASRSMTARY